MMELAQGSRPAWLFRTPGLKNGFSKKGESNMKKLLFAVTALAALSLLAPSTGFAQDTNQIGVYTDEDMTAVNVVGAANEQIWVYVVVSSPYNFDAGSEILSIGGVEFAFELSGATAMLLATEWAPPQVTDIGTGTSHICGFGAPLLVGAGGYVSVCSKKVFLMDVSAPTYVHLTPADPPSFPGEMVILDGGFIDLPMVTVYPSSGDYANPVFSFNGDIVATEAASIDQIKAMYR